MTQVFIPDKLYKITSENGSCVLTDYKGTNVCHNLGDVPIYAIFLYQLNMEWHFLYEDKVLLTIVPGLNSTNGDTFYQKI